MIERLAAITDQQVRFSTISENVESLRHYLAWMNSYVQEHAPDVHTQWFVSPAGSPSLLFVVGDGPPKVLMHGHGDVVPTDHHVYTTTREGFWLKGRGTQDMKGSIAALLDILVERARPGLGLLITMDEESGGGEGTGYVLQNIDWRPHVVILPDGGAGFRLVKEQKGLLRLLLHIQGTQAHAARPWLGNNALEIPFQVLGALRQSDRYPLPRFEEDWRVTISPTQMNDGPDLRHGSNAANVIPGNAVATWDIRFPASGPYAQQQDTLYRDVARLLKLSGISVECLISAPSFRLDTSLPLVRSFQRIAARELGKSMPEIFEAGASDARYFGDIPVFIYQPEGYDWHTPTERINLESLAVFRMLTAAVVDEFLGNMH